MHFVVSMRMLADTDLYVVVYRTITVIAIGILQFMNYLFLVIIFMLARLIFALSHEGFHQRANSKLNIVFLMYIIIIYIYTYIYKCEEKLK